MMTVCFADICQISVGSEREASVVDLSHIQNVTHRQVMQRLVENYKPERSQEFNIKIKLVLKDDEPIYQKARRLSAAERSEVNA